MPARDSAKTPRTTPSKSQSDLHNQHQGGADVIDDSLKDFGEQCVIRRGRRTESRRVRGMSFGCSFGVQPTTRRIFWRRGEVAVLQGVGKNQKNEQDHQEHVHQEQDDQESESG